MNNEFSVKPKILAVDDDPSVCLSLKQALSDDYDAQFASDARTAVQALHGSTFNVVLLDMNMPEISGMELLKMIRARRPDLPVVMLTGNQDLRTIIEAMKAGASDYIIKGTPDIEAELKFRLHQTLEKQRLIGRNKKLEAKIVHDSKKYEIVGVSPAIIKLNAQIAALAGHIASVLIQGESGTGKELVARALNSQEKDGTERPFIAINCAAVPENLAESEFFGHEKGAFTGASQRQEGKFVAADGGDLFLDEIGELSPLLQAKLLRVLQERVVTPVGAIKPIPVDVRIIAATHRNLQEEVKAGRFREDLYYRLNVIALSVPPLRERADDIPLLVGHFLRQFAGFNVRLTKEALEYVQSHSWSGNIRALRNCIERASFLSKGMQFIQKEHIEFCDVSMEREKDSKIPPDLLATDSGELSPDHLRTFMDWAEKVYYESAYSASGENKSRLSEKLGQSRDYTHRKLKTLGIGRPQAEVTV